MKKRRKPVSEETVVNEDIEAFEEWEEGGEKEAEAGSGGGHGLAGGMRIDLEKYPLFTKEIDDIINSIKNN